MHQVNRSQTPINPSALHVFQPVRFMHPNQHHPSTVRFQASTPPARASTSPLLLRLHDLLPHKETVSLNHLHPTLYETRGLPLTPTPITNPYLRHHPRIPTRRTISHLRKCIPAEPREILRACLVSAMKTQRYHLRVVTVVKDCPHPVTWNRRCLQTQARPCVCFHNQCLA